MREIFLRSGRIFLSEGEVKHDNYHGQLVRVGRKISCRGLRFAGGVTILNDNTEGTANAETAYCLTVERYSITQRAQADN